MRKEEEFLFCKLAWQRTLHGDIHLGALKGKSLLNTLLSLQSQCTKYGSTHNRSGCTILLPMYVVTGFDTGLGN